MPHPCASLSLLRATLLEKAGDIPPLPHRPVCAPHKLPSTRQLTDKGAVTSSCPDAVGTLLMVLELSASLAPPPLCPWDSVIGCTERPFLFSPFGLPSSSMWGPRHLAVAPFSLALSFQPCSGSEGSACAVLCHLSRELRRHLPGLRPALPERPRAALKQPGAFCPSPCPLPDVPGPSSVLNAAQPFPCCSTCFQSLSAADSGWEVPPPLMCVQRSWGPCPCTVCLTPSRLTAPCHGR